jgi:hypothetical protein
MQNCSGWFVIKITKRGDFLAVVRHCVARGVQPGNGGPKGFGYLYIDYAESTRRHALFSQKLMFHIPAHDVKDLCAPIFDELGASSASVGRLATL